MLIFVFNKIKGFVGFEVFSVMEFVVNDVLVFMIMFGILG